VAESGPVFTQVNLIVRDMDASIAFYRALGLEVDDAPPWPAGGTGRHTEISVPGGLDLELDNAGSVQMWNTGHVDADGPGTRAVIGFSLPSRQAVDDLYASMTEAGYPGRQPPFDAFFGARYAVVADPDGNEVGLTSPIDADRRFTPPPT
jgi:catechol 2,3-dioxygenase-like lactoylglutathione lyase family enzyme